MQRQISFWLGIFVALIVAIPIIMGVLSNAEDYAIKYSGFLAGIGFCIILTLILMLFFRESILKRITGSAKAEFVDLSEKIVLLFLEKTDEREKAEAVTEVTTTFANWYIWTRFYKWVIATCIAILIAAAGFAGSVLLAKQNAIMGLQKEQADLQNDLQIFETQAFIRAQLDTPPSPITDITDWALSDTIIPFSYNYCQIEGELNVSEHRFDHAANGSTLRLVHSRFQKEKLKPIVQEALNHLFDDNDSGVAMSSLLILDFGNHLIDSQDVLYGNNLGGNYQLENFSGSFHLERSFFGIECASCKSGYFTSSFIGETEMPVGGRMNIYMWDMSLGEVDEVDFSNIKNLDSSLILVEPTSHIENIKLSVKEQPRKVENNWFGVFNESGELSIEIEYLGMDDLNQQCPSFKNLCASNPFLKCNR